MWFNFILILFFLNFILCDIKSHFDDEKRNFVFSNNVINKRNVYSTKHLSVYDHKSLHGKVDSFESSDFDNLSYKKNDKIDVIIENIQEQSRRRTIRIRELTILQMDNRKELQTNETVLYEKFKNNQLKINEANFYINSIKDCIRKWQRVQIELQKLYKDQINEEKTILKLYQENKPNELELHKQYKAAIERWEMIYNHLIEMQKNEKVRNQERELSLKKLVEKLDQTNKNFSSSSFIYNSNTNDKKYYNLNSKTTYDFSEKKNSNDENHLKFERTEFADKSLKENLKTSSLKNIDCLTKWYDDLGKEDAEYITKQKLKNERLFNEIIRLQKAQWDKLYEEHNKKKQLIFPKTFKCHLNDISLCEQEKANFNRMFNEYYKERFLSKNSKNNNHLDQQYISKIYFK